MTPANTLRLRTFSSFRSWRPRATSLWGLVLVVGGAATVLSVAGCGSDSAAPACEAGAIVSCSGPQGCQGEQVCAADGASLGACTCDGSTATANDGSGGSSMDSVNSGTGGSEMDGAGGGAMGTAGSDMGAAGADMGAASTAVAYAVGTPCDADADCVDGLTCVSESMPGLISVGGPANGYCTRECQGNEECRAIDPLTVCQGTSAISGYCITACQGGDTQGNAKCIGPEGLRSQACTPPPGGGDLSVCLPRCDSDADCSEGRVCDPGFTGGCVEAPPSGGTDGAPCTTATEVEDCASGFCLQLTENRAVCAGFCTFGASLGCGFAEDATDRTAACLDTVTTDGGPGDLGLCFELCDVGTDCLQEGSSCQLFTSAANAELVGSLGFCEPEPVVAAE